MSAPIVNNETVKYVIGQLKLIEQEIIASQSALLAAGFLEFDANRITSQLESVSVTVKAAKPVDFPETHPHQTL